jgi:polygalacturonase
MLSFGAVRIAIATSTLAATPTIAATTGACHVTAYSAVAAATVACNDIILDNITVPGNSTLDLSKLKTGTKVTFEGRTFWEYFDANYPLIKVGGTNIEITATKDALLDGNGQAWWDGLGSNGGVAK